MNVYLNKILCLGDSLTQAYNIEESECWVSLLRHTTGITCINAGISGDSTTGMLGRIEYLILNHRPTHVVITGGTNDLSYDVPINIIMSNVHAMSRQAKYYGVQIVIGIPLEVFDEGFELEENQFINNNDFVAITRSYHDALRQFASENEFLIIDFAKSTNASHVMIDGVHPNQAGHKEMANIALKSLFPGFKNT